MLGWEIMCVKGKLTLMYTALRKYFVNSDLKENNVENAENT